jgi:hypothetical protein
MPSLRLLLLLLLLLLNPVAHISLVIKVLSRGEDEGDGGWAHIRAYRQLKYTQMQRQLAGLQKNAALRSGARGSQARKELLAFEKRVEEAKEK